MLTITTNLLPIFPQGRRSGFKNDGVKYIVAHDVGNDGTTAAGNVAFYHKEPGVSTVYTSVHYFVDDKDIIQILPNDEVGWHVNYGTGIAPNVAPHLLNDCSIGIELCYGTKWGTIRNAASYSNYTSLIASLCDKYHLDPKTALVGHYQVDPKRRTDPLNAFKVMGKDWLQFKEDVIKKLTPKDPVVPHVTEEVPTVVPPKVEVEVPKKVETKSFNLWQFIINFFIKK